MADENNNTTTFSLEHLLNEKRMLRISPSSTIENHEKLKMYKKMMRIATWNICNLFMTGRFRNVEEEINQINIDILGLSKIQWLGSDRRKTSRG